MISYAKSNLPKPLPVPSLPRLKQTTTNMYMLANVTGALAHEGVKCPQHIDRHAHSRWTCKRSSNRSSSHWRSTSLTMINSEKPNIIVTELQSHKINQRTIAQ